MAQLHYDETAKEERRKGIYVSRCVALSVALFNAVLIVACMSLLLTLRGTSPGVEVHRVVRQLGQVPGLTTGKRRYTPMPVSGPTTSPSGGSGSTPWSPSTNVTWSNASQPSNSLRLPRSILPYHYDIRWKPNLYYPTPEEFSVNGTARIYHRCYSPSNVISFNYRRLAFDTFSTAVDAIGNNTPITIASLCADRRAEWYNVTLDRNLSVGEEVILTLKYTAFIQNGFGANASSIGIFRSQYSIGNNTRYALFTQMEATDARRALPCFDDPDVKATFTISIDRETQFMALSNTPINYTYSENRSSNWVTDVFQTTKPMSTYLVAFAIFDYTNVTVYTSGMNPVKIGLWAQDNFVQAGYLNYASVIAPKLVDFYAMYYNYSFNWPKLDFASIPGKNFFIMENWGLTFLQSNYILFDKDRSDSVDLLNVTIYLAHLISHNWLGNTVTFEWWDDLWLTEGMGVYFQYLGVRSVQPTWDTEQFFISESFYAQGMWIDQYGLAAPVYNPNFTKFSDFDALFNDITYNKGAIMIRMLAKLIGEDAFRKAIQSYIQEYQYSNVDHEDLFEKMQEAYGKTLPAGMTMDFNVSDVFNTWILQSGYPLVTVVRGGGQSGVSSTQLTLSQNLFLFSATLFAEYRQPSPYGYLWEIPITYITSYNPNPVRVWMHKDKQIVIALNQTLTASDWILVNHNLSGYFRVNYDNDNWNALQAQLASDYTKIPLINRAQLIDDSFTLGRSGNVSQTLAFKISSYLTNETEYLPWKMFYDHFQLILRLFQNDNQTYARLQNYAVKLAAANYLRLGWNAAPNDTITTIFLRRLILDLTCSAGDWNCTTEALSRFQQAKSNGFNDSYSVTPDLRHIVYCAAAANITNDILNALTSRYEATVNGFTKESEEVSLAFACTRNVTLIAGIFQAIQSLGSQFLSIDNGFKFILENIAFTKEGYNAAWNYLNTYGLSAVGRTIILDSFVYVISTPEEAARLKSYLDQYPPRPEEQASVSWIQPIIQLSVAWKQQNQNAIIDYLTSLGF